jgi:xylulokinase
MKKYIAGIDVGTTGAKTIIFDLDGNCVGSGYVEYTCTYPNPGWVEQDPDVLVKGAMASAKSAIESSGIKPTEIASIGMSAQRCSVIFLDKDNKAMKMISWQDNRAVDEVKEIEQTIGNEKFYAVTGLPNSTTWILPKILWVRKNEPELWNKTVRMVQVHDYVLKALGASDYFVDPDDACFFGCYDTDKFEWHKGIMDTYDLTPEQFSTPRESAQNVGYVTDEAAEKSGFAKGTPLAVGSGDQNCASIGAGIVKTGMASVSLGTAGMATAFLDKAYRDPLGKNMVVSHAIYGKWEIEGLQNGAGGVLRWFRDEIADKQKADAQSSGEDFYVKLNEMISEVPPGAKGLVMMPYWASAGTPRWDPHARGTLIGLTFAHDKACMARAFMEGITLEQKDILTSMKNTGIKLNQVRIMGGATKSDIWNQMQADMYNLPVETLKVTDAAVLGAAICGAVSIGLFSGIAEAAQKMVKTDKRYEPNAQTVKVYEKIYEIYCAAYEALSNAQVFEKISEIQK